MKPATRSARILLWEKTDPGRCGWVAQVVHAKAAERGYALRTPGHREHPSCLEEPSQTSVPRRHHPSSSPSNRHTLVAAPAHVVSYCCRVPVPGQPCCGALSMRAAERERHQHFKYLSTASLSAFALSTESISPSLFVSLFGGSCLLIYYPGLKTFGATAYFTVAKPGPAATLDLELLVENRPHAGAFLTAEKEQSPLPYLLPSLAVDQKSLQPTRHANHEFHSSLKPSFTTFCVDAISSASDSRHQNPWCHLE
ncbi:hypothetical protein BP5796_00428 [Coleophoma crateriformis]|uniref:Uncharacterized protein n=1 Tax=Coleophoma crateriformis TaxID=565419 RepID=A0A3D8T814_9HELO|nr:hypothetical protein BP5796_00428 [Coleophoma crateriformis]